MKLLTVLISLILTLTVSKAGGQTIELPISDVKRVMARMESLKVDSIELQIRKADIIDLKNVTTSQLTTISNLRIDVMTYEARVSNYQSQVQVLEKDLKKQKRKTTWTAIGGLVLTAATAFLFLTK